MYKSKPVKTSSARMLGEPFTS